MLAFLFSFVLLVPSGDSLIPARPIVSAEAGGIKGDVHAPSGNPVSAVRILLKGQDGRSWVASTGPKGEFKAGSLPAGEYRVEFSKGKLKTAIYTKVMIKANSWLLGVAEGPQAQGTRRGPQLSWVGPVKYETPVVLITPKAPPKIEKIPMH